MSFRFLSAARIEAQTGVSAAAIEKAYHEKLLRGAKFGRSLLFDPEDVMVLVQGRFGYYEPGKQVGKASHGKDE